MGTTRLRIANIGCRVARKSFRAYIHPVAAVDAAASSSGLRLQTRAAVGPIWQVAVYERLPS